MPAFTSAGWWELHKTYPLVSVDFWSTCLVSIRPTGTCSRPRMEGILSLRCPRQNFGGHRNIVENELVRNRLFDSTPIVYDLTSPDSPMVRGIWKLCSEQTVGVLWRKVDPLDCRLQLKAYYPCFSIQQKGMVGKQLTSNVLSVTVRQFTCSRQVSCQDAGVYFTAQYHPEMKWSADYFI